LPNDVKLQEGHPVDENLRPLKVGGKSTAIETAQHGNGARVNGDLEVTGDIKGNIKDMVLEDVTVDSLITNSITSPSDLTITPTGGNLYLFSGAAETIDIMPSGGAGGAGASITFKSILNADDYFEIGSSTNGATILSTVDDDATEADLTFNIDGFIVFNSATGENIYLDSGGDIDISSNDGNFIMRKGDAEFSATNSAYAGMILGYSMIRNDQGYTGTNITDSVITLNQTSYTLIASAGGTKAGVTFIAPPSGKVEIEFWAMFKSTNDVVQFGLSSSHSSYTEVEDLQTYNSNILYFDESDYHPIAIRWVLEGLSGSNTVYVWYKVTSGTAYLYHGESYHHSATYHYPPITTKVTALPATFSITGD